MARKPTGKPVGPPHKPINWELFEELCSLQCTQVEIASCLKIHPDTLRDNVKIHYGEDYSMVYIKHSENGKISLRRYQYNMSKTNTAMAIWLGKHWLGQWDKVEHTNVNPQEKNNSLEIENAKLRAELALMREDAAKPTSRQDDLSIDSPL